MAQEEVSIDYQLTGSGWSECTIDVFGQRCVVTASYLSDALRELVSGVNHILGGGSEARFRFDEEPGEYRWILSRITDQAVAIRILEFAELWGEKADSEGKQLFEATCPIRYVADALLQTLNALLAEHGIEGYRKKWLEAEFPKDDYLKLCAHLGFEPAIDAFNVRRVQN
jgi:hypothetical protein